MSARINTAKLLTVWTERWIHRICQFQAGEFEPAQKYNGVSEVVTVLGIRLSYNGLSFGRFLAECVNFCCIYARPSSQARSRPSADFGIAR